MKVESSYIGVDLGARSGRVILGTLSGRSRVRIREMHRFANEPVMVNGHLHWDTNRLFSEVKKGLRSCAAYQDDPVASLGIDTWGVDFGVIDRAGKLIGLPYSYRDDRTGGMVEKFTQGMPARELYRRTGVQIHRINTLFQLYAMVCEGTPVLKKMAGLLFMPDLFNYLLTGRLHSEFTIATTSQLYNPVAKEWDRKIFKTLGISPAVMQPVLDPGSRIAGITDEVSAATGLGKLPVVAVASHDTASAVAAVPAQDPDYVYISSGTWSLMGIETIKPIINKKTWISNLTNEGGIFGTYRVLKNITGLWLLQECRRSWDRTKKYSHDELTGSAEAAVPWRSVIDPESRRFFTGAADMPDAIRSYCRDTDQPVPDSVGDHVRCILESLALSYRHTLEELRGIDDRRVRRVHVVGGGSRDSLLCQLTADTTGLPVHAGPQEASAIGNILTQAMAADRLGSLAEMRNVVQASFEPAVYQPRAAIGMEKAYAKFLAFKKTGQ